MLFRRMIREFWDVRYCGVSRFHKGSMIYRSIFLEWLLDWRRYLEVRFGGYLSTRKHFSHIMKSSGRICNPYSICTIISATKFPRKIKIPNFSSSDSHRPKTQCPHPRLTSLSSLAGLSASLNPRWYTIDPRISVLSFVSTHPPVTFSFSYPLCRGLKTYLQMITHDMPIRTLGTCDQHRPFVVSKFCNSMRRAMFARFARKGELISGFFLGGGFGVGGIGLGVRNC